MPRGGHREGAGKKQQYDEPLDETIKFRLSATEKQAIHYKAKQHNLSVGRFIVEKCGEEEE